MPRGRMKLRTFLAVIVYGVLSTVIGLFVSASMYLGGTPGWLAGAVMVSYSFIAVMAMISRAMED